jgi:hypothetical protein
MLKILRFVLLLPFNTVDKLLIEPLMYPPRVYRKGKHERKWRREVESADDTKALVDRYEKHIQTLRRKHRDEILRLKRQHRREIEELQRRRR